MKKPIIQFTDFTFQYNSQSEPTLKNLNVTIYEGEKILVVGPSGSGKSTFANCINGLIPNQYEGKITGDAAINGQDLVTHSLFDHSFSTSTVLQDTDGQFIGLTVAEDIAFLLENDGVEQQKMHDQVAYWAEVVSVDGHLNNRPQDLSGGQKQRVSMAGVLINEAPILLFDEPLANLDPAAGKEAIHLIDRIHQKNDTTIIIIEHRLEDVLTSPIDRILIFNEGQIIADETPEVLLKTNILAKSGIREPLYISALKKADVNLNHVSAIADVEKVKGPGLREKLILWQEASSVESQPAQKIPLLELKNINYRYRKEDHLVLDQLTTTIYQGEKISIVGKNGAGKSTLFKAICGFIATKGEMNWKGMDLTRDSIKERADKIGYVLQNPNQMISQKMIFDEVALGLRLRNIEEGMIKKRVEKVLTICGLYPFRNWPISALSYGQKKRVTIASILVLEPEMIILDEPTAGQDYHHYSEMMLFLDELNALGKTIVMITHDMHLMLEYSERTLVVDGGRILADDTPIAILTSPHLVAQASLKETSLFTLAKQIGLADPVGFTQHFIDIEKEVNHG